MSSYPMDVRDWDSRPKAEAKLMRQYVHTLTFGRNGTEINHFDSNYDAGVLLVFTASLRSILIALA